MSGAALPADAGANRRRGPRVQADVTFARLSGLLLAVAAVAVASCGGSDRPPDGQRDAGADDVPLRFSKAGWKTAFARSSVPLTEFISGGPGRDGIPPIDEPQFLSVAAAAEFLDRDEPVLSVELDGRARAYPHQILIWHEIVNDTLAGRPIAVTYCPLCNSSLVFDRRVGGRVLTFGTTGNLRNSDLVMWDRQTESWWQQLTGEAVVGELTGTRLEVLESQTLSFADFRARYPEGEVLSRQTGFQRDYGRNPYERYDKPDEQPFLLDRDVDGRLPPKERVLSFIRGDRAVVVPFSSLERHPVVQLDLDGQHVLVLFEHGVRSSLDADVIAESRDVGTATAFDRRLDRRALSFAPDGSGRVRDRETGSTWDITGTASAGPLAGRRLRSVRHDVQFWFAVAAFLPDATIVR
jgi:hypothetical protein